MTEFSGQTEENYELKAKQEC